MKYFCPNCGKPNDYINGSKPNFCSNCGNNFKNASVAKIKARPYSQENHENEDDDSVDIEELNIGRDSFEITGHQEREKFGGVPISSIIGTSASLGSVGIGRQQQFRTTQEILEQYKKSASSSRKPTEITERGE